MLRYYFVLFFRNFQRQKLFSLINILGLSAGVCSTILIYLYVSHELSYDKFHTDVERIYRVNQTFIWGEDNDNLFSSVGPGVAFALKAELPEVEEITRIHTPGEHLVTYEENGQLTSFYERNILAADSNMLDVFTFKLLEGDKESALQNPNSLIITKTTAKKYFKNQNALGRQLQLESGGNKRTFQITGVTEDVPANSHIQFDMVMSMNSIPRVKTSNWSWIWTMFVTFVKVNDHVNIEHLRAKLDLIPPKYTKTTLEQIMGTTFEEYTKGGKEWKLYLQPMSDVHLGSENVYSRLNTPGSLTTVYALGGAGLFIMLLSCINFMNLSTSQYMKRAKNTGIRKILGSSRLQLSLNYISEAFIYCFISLTIGLLVAYYLLPDFNDLTAKPLEFDLFGDGNVFLFSIGLLMVISLLSGSYPAVFLSAFSPIDTMKGKIKTGNDSKIMRHGLVVFQFVCSLILIASTFIVFNQLKFTNQMDLGFDKENLLSIERLESIESSESILNQIQKLSGVTSASLCTSIPPNIWGGDQFKPNNPANESKPLNFARVDENYIETLDLKLREGRSFSKEFPNDVNGIILNEMAVKSFGWDITEGVIGKNVYYEDRKYEVLGVLKDFNYWSLQTPIEPFALIHINANFSYAAPKKFIAVKINSGNGQELKNSLAAIEGVWNDFNPNTAIQHGFVDDAFAAAFQDEDRFGQVLSVLAGLAIFIAGLGLLGMIIYTVEQRTKEIGIRKIVGASAANIVQLISIQHIKLILIAIFVSTPITVLLMQNWLNDFMYRVSISPWVFVGTGSMIVILALSISGYHSFRASLTNPVDVLKDE